MFLLIQADDLAVTKATISRDFIQSTISDLVRSYVGDEVDANAPLAQQGLDSLAAMELRQKLQV